MAVKLMLGCSGDSFGSKLQENALKEAATVGIQRFHPEFPYPPATDNVGAVTDAAVSSFKKVISLLGRTTNRTGHARFRRAPVSSPPANQISGDSSRPVNPPPPVSAFRVYQPSPVHCLPPLPNNQLQKAPCSINFTNSPATSFVSSLTGETDSLQRSVSSGFQSAGKPPLSSSSLKRKCSSMNDASLKCGGSSSGRCHCSKKRKSKVKRVIRVPAVSSKSADIPPDNFSWRKYGQKPIKGSPHPRGYYKCSSERGCPARKHVERALDDPMVLIITYECDHNHFHSNNDAPTVRVLESSQ